VSVSFDALSSLFWICERYSSMSRAALLCSVGPSYHPGGFFADWSSVPCSPPYIHTRPILNREFVTR
jgi:hypothetical protein